ncbi:phage terminase small subunit-related protein [Fusobacterium ulcerans]|uniref:phage terminase small subunit-related protein n=1 Tax=Fusobacterium ulcerans TaxID=861 RepID=UPI00241C4173|nr:phage terminase small subunit-related protein [Fusobacterium ulcerans]
MSKARARDPTTEDKEKKYKAFVMWIEAGGKSSPKGTLTKIADVLGVTSGTVRGWKSKGNWEQKETDNCNVAKDGSVASGSVGNVNKEEVTKLTKMAEANNMYLAGNNANKIAKKLGVKSSTVNWWISKYKWVEAKERLLIKVTEKLYQKHKRDRFKERESSYRYAALIRGLAIQKITGKEFTVNDDNKKIRLPRITGKVLAAEMSALSMAIKIIEDTNKFQDKLLGIKDGNTLIENIGETYRNEMKEIFEREKFALNAELKLLEIESKDNGGDNSNSNSKETEELEKELDSWVEEVWKK